MQPATTQPAHAACGARTRSGHPCKNAPIHGGTRCRMHGGSTPTVIAKAKQRVLEARIQGQLEQRGWEPLTDPLTAYADLAGEVWAFKELCRDRITELHTWDIRNDIGSLDLAPTITVYERAIDRAQKTIHDMLRLGLDHQALRQARERPTREQAEGLSRILDTVIDGLNLTPNQRVLVPDLIADAIRQEANA